MLHLGKYVYFKRLFVYTYLVVKNIDNSLSQRYPVLMSSLHTALIDLGLTDKEARVYIALVSLGESVVYVIADRAGLKRPTAYVTLNSLVQKGFAKRIPKARKQLYFPVSPDEVYAQARERLRNSERILPELRAMTQAGQSGKVQTTCYEGQDQVLQAFMDTLNYGNCEVNGWLSEQPWRSTGGKGWWHSEYRPQRLAQNIYHRFIVPNAPSMQTYAQEDVESLKKEVLVVYDKEYQPKADILLYGGSKTLITSFHEKMGVIIESTLIYETLSAMFEREWRVGKEHH